MLRFEQGKPGRSQERRLWRVGSAAGVEWAEKLRLFVAEINRIFTTDELRRYFATRVGAAGHVARDDEYETMRDAGMFDNDVVSGAADAILFERACVLVLGDDRGHP